MYSTALAISFWQRLEDVDKWLFLKINNHTSNPVFDAILPYLRDSVFWAPLYVFIIAFIGFNFGKKGIWWSIGFLCTVALADLIGTYGFKQNFQRLRPCHDPYFFSNVRLLLKNCSPSYSFISNHAANHFGLATFMVLTLRGTLNKWIYLAFAWAFFIAYAQVYVGVHYPTDVLAGAIVGIMAGWVTAVVLHKNFGELKLQSLNGN